MGRNQFTVGQLIRSGSSNGAVTVLELDDSGLVSSCKGATASLPSAVAGYAVGCIFIDTTTGHTYANTGSATSCSFDDVGAAKVASQSLDHAAFTDNTDASGYIDITTQIPAGAIVLGWKAVVSEAFAGDTTATIQVGIAGALDKYSVVTTVSVASIAAVGCSSKLSANTYESALVTARVTVTGTADWGNVTAGTMVVTIYYLATA